MIFATSASAMAGTLSETFFAGETLPRGAVVALSSQFEDTVIAASASETKQVLGVVNADNESSISIRKKDGAVDVALAGNVFTLVSDINGSINQGDTVVVSWIEGVAMRADGEGYAAIGIAQEDFDPTSATEYGMVDTPEGERSARVDSIVVRLLDRSAAEADKEERNGIAATVSLAVGKNVSFLRIVIATGIFVATLVVSGAFVSSSLRGGFISIGRNPMASSSIQQSMIRVATLAALALVIGTTLAYVVMVL